MAGVNRVIIIGNLGNDPDIRTMPNGEPVATLSVATSEAWTDKQTGERREQTEWHRIVFWQRQAEICGQYLKKGSKVYVEGKLKTRKWTDQHGVERYITEIHGNNLQMLDSRDSWQGQNNEQQAKPQASSNYANNYAKAREGNYTPPPKDNIDDTIPF